MVRDSAPADDPSEPAEPRGAEHTKDHGIAR